MFASYNPKPCNHFDVTHVYYTKMRNPVPPHYKETILRRQNHKCKLCSVFLDVYDIDHVVPYRIHPVHKLSNLQALCPNCHAKKTRNEAGHLAFFIRCEQTPSYRYCWKCKHVVSKYFGFYNGICSACYIDDTQTHLNNIDLHKVVECRSG